MRFIFTLIKGLLATVALIVLGGLAVVYTPATEAETAMFGPTPERSELLYRRIALGASMIDETSLFDGIAARLDVSPGDLRTAVFLIANGTDPDEIYL